MNLIYEKTISMKKSLLIPISLLFISTMSYAGSFDGPYVGVGAGAQYSGNSNFKGTTSKDISDTHFVGQITAGYSYEIAPRFNLAANAFFNLSDDKAGKSSTISATTKNNIGISLEPGYYINDNTLAYLKVGYARIDSKLNDNTISTNDSLNGYLFGAGAKYLIDKNIYLGAEVTQYNYGNNTAHLSTTTQYKTEQTVGLVTFGYQF